jgi:hypothetical protein
MGIADDRNNGIAWNALFHARDNRAAGIPSLIPRRSRSKVAASLSAR